MQEILRTYTKALEEILCLGVDLELSGLALAEVKSRHFGDVLILSLSLLFLELEGDTTDGTTLNTLHQMGGVAGNLFRTMLESDLISPLLCASRTLLRRRLDAIIAISSQILLLVSKSRVNLG
jgi:hypothetical protein